MTMRETESVHLSVSALPPPMEAFFRKKKKRNILIPGRSSVSDGRSQPADLSSGCISLP